MGRPRKQPQDRVKKDAFSGPRYLLAAAKQAAGVAEGNDFSPWVVAAIREKLEREQPGLMAKMRAEMQGAAVTAAPGDYVQPEPRLLAAAEPGEAPTVENVTNSLADKPFAALSLGDMRREVARMEDRVKAEIEREKAKKGRQV